MPCSDCNHILVYNEEKDVLYCPSCLDLPVADKEEIKAKASAILDEYLNNPQLIQILEEFGALRVIAGLLNQLNGGAYGMPNENRMQFKKFFTPTPIIKTVYANSDRFDHHFDPDNDSEQGEVDEHIDAALGAGTTLIPVLNQIRENFAVTLEYTPGIGDWTDFYGNHEFRHSEYWLCSERCLRSTVGGQEEIREQFLEQQEIFRTFSKSERGEIETVRDYADFWHGFIASMGFGATLDDSLQEAFTTYFPKFVTIFDIEALLENIDHEVSDQLRARGEDDYRPLSLDESTFDECGEDVFGSDWEEVKDCVLVSESNVDAHPMFFKFSGTQKTKLPNWRRSRATPFEMILYPDYFAGILKFQIFPLLKNGELETSADVLEELNGKRGLEFERNVFEYLQGQEIEAYHSCKTAKQNGNEVDVIFVRDGTLYFVEVKFVLPTLNMQTQRGIRDVNAAFDKKVFNEGIDDGGKPFDEKVRAWLDLDPGFEFTHQEGQGENDRVTEEIPSEWGKWDVELLVVSNFVPSYLEKRRVQFLTDLELHQWIAYTEDVFTDVLKPLRVF